jgi:hypothetical protein
MRRCVPTRWLARLTAAVLLVGAAGAGRRWRGADAGLTIEASARVVVWLVANAGAPPEWKACEWQVRTWAPKRFGKP